MQLRVTPSISASPEDHAFEIVERKGFGHPDTLCDSLAEAVSVGLTRLYLDRFGVVLHHNVDKALLLAGAAQPAFSSSTKCNPPSSVPAAAPSRCGPG